MSFDGHVLCHRILIAPCALTTFGAATAAVVASAGSLRNLRRVAADEDLLGIYFLPGSDLTDDMVRLSRLTRPNGSYSSRAGCMGCSLYGVLSPRTRHELSRPTPQGTPGAERANRARHQRSPITTAASSTCPVRLC